MNKNIRTILILLLVLAMCIGAFVAVKALNRSTTAKEEAEAEASVIKLGNIVDGQYISITMGGITYEYLNNGESWVYVQDEAFPLEDSYLTAVVDAALNLYAEREIEISYDLEEYSLDEGSYLAVRIMDSEKNIFALNIGAPIGDGSRFYAKDPDLDTIYIIDNTLPEAASFDLYDMIEFESFGSFEPTDITSITVTADEQQLIYKQETASETAATGQYDEDTGEEIYEANIVSTWYDASSGELVLMEDDAVPASLAETAAELEFYSCKNYNASDSLLENSGLKAPSITVTVTWTDISGEEMSQTLIVGRLDKNGYYWSKLVDSNAVYMIEGAYVEGFLAAAETLNNGEQQ